MCGPTRPARLPHPRSTRQLSNLLVLGAAGAAASVGTTETSAKATTVIAVTTARGVEDTTTARVGPTIAIATIGAGESPRSDRGCHHCATASPHLHASLRPAVYTALTLCVLTACGFVSVAIATGAGIVSAIAIDERDDSGTSRASGRSRQLGPSSAVALLCGACSAGAVWSPRDGRRCGSAPEVDT